MRINAAMNKLSRDIDREMVNAVNRTAVKVLAKAKKKSSGPMTLVQMRRQDHPYALRHGSMGLTSKQTGGRPHIINVQSGNFKAAWSRDQATLSDNSAKARVVNNDPKADFLKEGTDRMVPRPIKEELENEAKSLLEGEVRYSLRILESKHG